MWSIPDEKLLDVLCEATLLKLDIEFIELIQSQIHLRKKKIDFCYMKKKINTYAGSVK